MYKQLPPNPNLEYDKKQAKTLLKAYRTQEPEALKRVKSFHPRLQHSFEQHIPSKEFTLSDAQLVIAREYGCWNMVQTSMPKVLGGQEHSALCMALIRRWLNIYSNVELNWMSSRRLNKIG
jgi:hypothetical protein